MLAIHRLPVIGAIVILVACGGGGGGGGSSGPSFTVSPGTLNFSAFANAGVPLAQAVTVTVSGVSSGFLFFRVTIPGGLVASVSSVSITGPNTGQAFVTVVPPTTLGTGMHNGTISVVACTTDAACSGPLLGGSPQTIAVNYTVNSTLQGDAVAPHVVPSGVPGEVVLRGTGLAALTSVAFDGNGATFTQLGTTEVRANYPALVAGTYPVQLQNVSGSVAFSGDPRPEQHEERPVCRRPPACPRAPRGGQRRQCSGYQPRQPCLYLPDQEPHLLYRR